MRFSFETANMMFNYNRYLQDHVTTPLQRIKQLLLVLQITQATMFLWLYTPAMLSGLLQHLKLPRWFATTIPLEYSRSSHYPTTLELTIFFFACYFLSLFLCWLLVESVPMPTTR
jgi:hypothetical protein